MRLGTYYRYLVTRELNLPLSGNRVLDIGCYDGFLLSQVNSQSKFGIDIDPVHEFDDVQYIRDDFLEHDFGDERFDRIFALDVLEHVKQDREFLEKVLRLLSQDGTAILSTPNKAIRVFPAFLQTWVDRRWEHTLRRGYSKEEIELLANAKDMRVICWNCPLFRFLYFPSSLLWRLFRPLAKALLYLTVKVDSRFRDGEKGFLYLTVVKDG